MNAYLKIVPFVYLFAAAFFIYSAIARKMEGQESWFIWLFFAGLCVFMFFFRRRFASRFDNNPNNKK